ncbi:tetratricopeptide repeat protein [Bosea sp. SSUT16]|uniref:Tetratricopeptide repeat protein 38 n=1 Tax=Bosea spartocytisi TaxID=2773451 RepID=A0A927EB42_9HYPH|nr:tetratricopeptide repeat protein [Bosea spartocytisi]MBD3847643.1 tetratricopeptide repeat protein [Bosea spartocytisi]MCT4472183.1 tetratricopeptide repeat protein [Bosea spartocytisi]
MSQPLYHDLSGDSLTIANDSARLAWNDTLEALLAHAAVTPEHLARTLASDPDFALAHAAKGLMLLSLARAELLGPARDCLATARSSALLRPVTRREQMVIEALALWLDDAPRRAAERLEAILLAHPHDVLALKLSHGLRFMLGDQREMLATLNRFAPAFGESHPLAGYVHGCYAFALEERGLYAEAERTGRHAVSLSPRDAWGRHAVAHVLEMTGRADEGVAWLGDGREIAHANNLRFHIFWHLALFRLERGETAEVLRLYDDEIRAEPTDDYRDIANGASLLARLDYAGVDVGDRWEELAAKAEGRVQDGRLVFADLHYLLSLLGAGHRDAAESIAQSLVRDAHAHPSRERAEAARSGALAAHGLIAFSEGDHAEAARLLGAARSGLLAIGGSHAQRDLFEQAHIESLIRAGSHDLAARILEQRLARRGGANRFAMRRLAQLRRQPSGRLAALAVAATPLAIAH